MKLDKHLNNKMSSTIKHLLYRISLKIITSAYIISTLNFCNALVICDIPKLQEIIDNN